MDSEHATDLLGELGDVLWCATALASNSTADVDSAIKARLQEYTNGTGVIDGLDTLPPSWHEGVAKVATKWDNIEMCDVSDVIAFGFEPRQSPAMNIDEDDGPEREVEGHIELILFATNTLACLVEKQYCYGDVTELSMMTNDYYKSSRIIAELCAEIYLNVAYVTHHRLGMSLQDVVAKNVAKLNARIQAKRVDKTDGQRSTELL